MTRSVTLALALCTVALGCGDRPELRSGETCTLNTDCEEPLVCRLERCRRECFRSRDCPAGQVCLVDEDGLGACQVEEDECESSTDCGGALVCRFGECTNACMDHEDCPAGSMCLADDSGDRGCVDPSEQECDLNTDCVEPLICATDERCREQCVEDRDCRDGASCVTMGEHQVCTQPTEADAGMDGGGIDASMVGDSGTDGGVVPGVDGGDGGPDAGTDAGTASFGPTDAHTFIGGALHTCAVTDAGGVWCWGANDRGQIGDGTILQRQSPVEITPLAGIVEGTAGGQHSCARSNTQLWCWGNNDNGQVGDGSTTERRTPAAIGVGFTTGSLLRLAAGSDHTCALDDAGDVWCWGSNASGQLGDGTGGDRTSPTAVTGLGGVVEGLCADGSHTCALLADATVECWGSNANGQLGDGTTTDSQVPVAVTGLAGVAEVGCGNDHTCARLTDGSVRCWGANDRGQLGDGTTTDRHAPVATLASTDITQLGLGIWHTCARRSTGTVECWGLNSHYQLGTTPTSLLTPSDPVVSMASDAVQLGTGTYHNCYRDLTGSFLCWGRNTRGQLGDGTIISNPAPVTTGL